MEAIFTSELFFKEQGSGKDVVLIYLSGVIFKFQLLLLYFQIIISALVFVALFMCMVYIHTYIYKYMYIFIDTHNEKK